MNVKLTLTLLGAIVLACLGSSPGMTSSVQQPPKADIDPANFVGFVDNPYFPLVPGTTFHYEGNDEGVPLCDIVEVTFDTETILGVQCIVVRDLAFEDGVLVEDTFDWFAQDVFGNVWYFGEDSKELDEDGNIVSTEGSWKAGVDGARAGIIMLANPQVHDQYYQEYAKQVAEDKARVLSTDETVATPFGNYENVVSIREWSRLDPGVVETKYYSPGIGFIKSEGVKKTEEFLELVDIEAPPL